MYFFGTHTDLVMQAQMFNDIVGILERTDIKSHPALDQILTRIRSFNGDHHGPRIFLSGYQLNCHDCRLDLAGKPQQYRLFSMFLDADDRRLNLEQILINLYGANYGAGRSRRYIDSLESKTVKLISRCRLAVTSQTSDRFPELEWFDWDQKSKSWLLHKVRSRATSRLA